VSPELILVASPEEARLAREQLVEAAPRDWDEFLANIPARAAAGETAAPTEALPRPLPEGAPGDWDEFLANIRARPVASETAAPPAVAPPRRKHRVRFTLISVVVAAAAAFGILRAVRAHDETAPAVFRAPAAAERTQTHQTVAPKPAATRKPAKTPKFVPARVFSWPAERAATRYLVRFFRNGHKVLEKRTVRARLVLPKSFVFRPGTYRWTVVPLGVAEKRPLVDSRFVVS
jgi:hypothetical protein